MRYEELFGITNRGQLFEFDFPSGRNRLCGLSLKKVIYDGFNTVPGPTVLTHFPAEA